MPETHTGRILGGGHDGENVSSLFHHLRMPRLVNDGEAERVSEWSTRNRMRFETVTFALTRYYVGGRLYGFWVPEEDTVIGTAQYEESERAAILSLIDADPKSNEIIRIR